MAHRFDRSKADPYSESAKQIEANLFTGHNAYKAGAQDEMYDVLSNAIVSSLGDIAAQAYRNGVDEPEQMHRLSRAVQHACDAVFHSYAGEVDPRSALDAIANDPRRGTLTPEAQQKLGREIEKTRQLEELLLTAKRLPDLIDFAGSLGLEVHEDVMEQGTLLVGRHPTPNAESQQ